MTVTSKEAKTALSLEAPTLAINAPLSLKTITVPLPLERVSCIYYPVQFKKDQTKVRALIDSSSEVNAMTPTYTKKLGLQIRKIDIGAQKIDGSTLETFGIAIASF